MLAGFAFLNRNSDSYIAEYVQRFQLSELAPVSCVSCEAVYRLFAKPSNPRDEEDAKSDIRDLTQRAESIIHRECKGRCRISRYEFFESGKVAI